MAAANSAHFLRFWLGQAASNLGDAFGFVAMPLLVLDATHSVVQMGNVTAFTGTGQLLAASLSGVLVDRVNRRGLMVVCDLARLALYGLLPVLAAASALHLPALFAIAGLAGAFSNIYLVCYMAAVANLVEPEEVARANGRLAATQALTYVVGSALAGVVCSRFGAAWAMGVNALSFAASALTLVQIRFRRDRAERDPNEARGPVRELQTGLRFLAGHPALRSLTLFQGAVALLGSIGVGAAIIDVIVFRLKVDLAESGNVVGYSLALASLGAVFGALLGGRLGRRIGFGKAAVVGTALQGLGLVIGGLGPGLGSIIVAGMFWSGGLTFRAVGASSLRQTLTPDALLGRVLAAGWVLIFGGSALGAVLVTRASAGLGAAHALALIGGGLLAVALVGSFSALTRAAES